jgi:LCP family protein required for cell wall assembly
MTEKQHDDSRMPQDAGGPVSPELESFLRPTGTAASLGAGKTPLHDHVSPSQLEPYESMFRDSPPPDINSATTPQGSVTYSSPMPQAGTVATDLPPPAQSIPASGPSHVIPEPRRRWRRILMLVLAGLMAYFTILATIFALSVNKIDAMPASQIASTAGTNYLLVGSDGRQDLTAKERKQLHVGNVDGNRTDTIMILNVPLIGQPTLVSIPRDSWVPIPGHGSDKINAAFALGGPELLVETVELTTGLHIDNYVEVGMVGVARITDALGGVTLCPDRRYNDEKSNLNVKKGCQEMEGKTALAYVRMRYADPKGDIGRAERQQEYMKSATMKSMSPLTWLNPFKMISVATTAGDSLTVDEGTGIVDDARMAMAMGMISMGWGESTAVPIQDDNYWVNGQQAVKWDTPAALELFRSLGG